MQFSHLQASGGCAKGVKPLEQLQAANLQTPWGPNPERDAASATPQLAAVLRQIALKDEVVVVISNDAVDGGLLQHWCALH